MSRAPCRYRVEDRVAFAYGELEPERARAFEAHLTGCDTCRREVAELRQAAELCRTLRQAELPAPVWTRPLRLPGRPAGLRWWRRAALWAPLAAAAAAAVIWFLVAWPAGRSTPGRPPLAPPARSAPAPLDITVVAVSGAVERIPAGGQPAGALSPAAHLLAGDELAAADGAGVVLALADESRLGLGPGSRLRLLATGQDGDRFELLGGDLACRVSPRGAGRRFAVRAGRFEAVVKGTRFAVRLAADGRLVVGVAEGLVQVRRPGPGGPAVAVAAGQQAQADPTGGLELVELEPAIEALMLPPATASGTEPAGSPAVRPRANRSRPDGAVTDRPRSNPPLVGRPFRPGPTGSKPAPRPEASVPPEAGSPRPAPGPATESLEALVARLHQDTDWIFDDLKRDVAAGRCDRVLGKLDNYLADPDSPRRDQATFLRAVCLEKLGRKPEAMRAYRRYLMSWPRGPRAADARAAMRRIRGGG